MFNDPCKRSGEGFSVVRTPSDNIGQAVTDVLVCIDHVINNLNYDKKG